jgi:hypothetical protein
MPARPPLAIERVLPLANQRVDLPQAVVHLVDLLLRRPPLLFAPCPLQFEDAELELDDVPRVPFGHPTPLHKSIAGSRP